jgi:membrane protein implicated in regulation of membrane protease activity
MVGAKGVVAERSRTAMERLDWVIVFWLAEGPNAKIGTPVIVTEVRGTVVLVSKL